MSARRACGPSPSARGRARWLAAAASVSLAVAAPLAAEPFADLDWSTVVNSGDLIPGDPLGRRFNSYNQPSVNRRGLVVFRARSRGRSGEPATHGIYTRETGDPGASVRRVLDRAEPVPEPNNLGATFIETPSYPRIGATSDTVVTRGDHQPTWRYRLDDGSETRAGTSGIYVEPIGPIVSGATKLGAVPDLAFFAVPQTAPPIPSDVFPGAPAVTDGATLVFKGNCTVDGQPRTGVYFRELGDAPIALSDGRVPAPAGGEAAVAVIADTTTVIPGTGQLFGSTAPPSAVGRRAVFAGFDDESNPAAGGIYLAGLGASRPPLTTLVGIGSRVPGEAVNSTFTRLGESVAFDGRYVAFWGDWDTVSETDPESGETRCISGCIDQTLRCPTEGNRNRIAYCLAQCPGPAGCTVSVPRAQGLFVHDTARGRTRTVAERGNGFEQFLFWNFSGRVLGASGDGDDDGEAARWRSWAFVAASASGANTCRAVFKTDRGDRVGLYLVEGPGQATLTVLDTRADGQAPNPEALPGSRVTEIGIEREGLRREWLAINAKMGGDDDDAGEADDIAGIHVTRLR